MNQPTGGNDHTGGVTRPQCGIAHSIRPGTAVPATLLVADLGSGALLLQGWRDGPAAYLTARDAEPVHRALAATFGCE